MASGISRTTVIRAVNELALGPEPIGRQRAPGGGDKPAIEKQEGLRRALTVLIRPRGWDQSAARVLWTPRSTYAASVAVGLSELVTSPIRTDVGAWSMEHGAWRRSVCASHGHRKRRIRHGHCAAPANESRAEQDAQ